MDTKIKAVIIDDMPLAIASLRADVEDNFSDIEIVGVAEGVLAGAKLVKASSPQLLFLDIQMDDGDGFDLLDIIERKNIQVIFTTASKDHAIKAFRFAALDYLLKPIEPNALRSAIEKARQHIIVQKDNTNTSLIARTLALNTQEEIRLVKIDDIIRLEAMGNYTRFYFGESQKMLVTRTMKEFVSLLPDYFLRVHQSHLVNKHRIEAYIKTEGGYLKMTDGSHVPVSVRKKAFVMEALSA
jgi:two-component system LytT family response regulator